MEKININQLRQQQEEKRAINSVYDKIVREFIKLEHIGADSKKPDFRLNYNGLNICIEMTRIEPYKNRNMETQCVIENAVEKIVRKVIKDKGKNPLCSIHIILGSILSTLKKGTRINKIQNIERIIGAALNGRVNREYFTEFKVNRKIGAMRLMKKEEHVATLKVIEKLMGKPFPEINFSNPGGFLDPISEKDILTAIKHKENEYSDYKNNRGESFDEVWLCLYLPDSEHGFTIRGASIPTINSQYERIYLSEEKSPFARLIYNKTDTPKLDI